MLRTNVEIVHHRVDELHASRRNARTHSKRQIGQIARSIETFGFLSPIIVDEQNRVLAGHGRLAAAKQSRLATVPTLCLEGLSDAQKRAYVLADNKIAEGAGWDRELLQLELAELIELLPAAGLDVTITGFEPAEIDLLDADFGNPDAGDRLPPKLRTVVTRPGDVWLMRQHRLVCGDARSEEDLNRALPSSEKVHAVFTDPPYNVPVFGHVGGKGKIARREFVMASGEMSEAEFSDVPAPSPRNAAAVSLDGAIHYVCMDWRHITELLAAGKAPTPS